MARPREFDIETVLMQSMNVFWMKGYKATSLEDLMNATQLNKQSLYCAFGDKRSLFLKVLEFYRTQRLASLETNLSKGDNVLEAVHQVLKSSIIREPEDERPPGCLYVSTALEFGSFDAEITQEVNKMFEKFEALLTHVVERGQQNGGISTKFSASVIAKSILNTLMGLRVLEKRGVPLSEMEAVLTMCMETVRA